MRKKIIILIFILSLFIGRAVFADEIILKNGDRVSGAFVRQTKTHVVINSSQMGRIAIEKRNIKTFMSGEEAARRGQKITASKKKSNKTKKPKVKKAPRSPIGKKLDQINAAQREADLWQKKVSLGYSQVSGNTNTSALSGEMTAVRKTDSDELAFKLGGHYASSNNRMDAKKFYGSGRYAQSFGPTSKWYRFGKFEADQDIFANVDYRLIPSAGVGYWFADTQDFKAMVEGAIGYEYTAYRNSSNTETQGILIPRGFLETKILGDARLIQDFTYYPSLKDTSVYRIHSETSIINPINEKASLRLSFVDDFNSRPPGAKEKNDYRLMSSLDWSF